MRIIRAAATVGGYTGISRIFGMIREILMSYILGAGAVSDAFIVAFKFPNFFRRIFAEGAFNASFVPVFAGKLATEGMEEAQKTATHVFSVMMLSLTALVVVVWITLPWLIYGLAPGFATTPERLEMAITFTRITFPYILFISLTALLSGILNSLDRFAAAAATPVLLNVLMILGLLGGVHFNLDVGQTLSWSVFVAGIVQLVWLYFVCLWRGVVIKIEWPRLSPDVKKVMKLMIPGTIGAGVMQINLLMDMVIASLLPQASLSYLYYADRLNQLPLSIFGVAIGTALLPLLSRQIRAGNIQAALKSQDSAVELAIQLTMPAMTGLIVMAFPIISLIYGHGAFTPEDVNATAPTLMAFAAGLPAYVLGKVFATHFFAHHDTKTPVKIAVFCMILNIVLSLILMIPFKHVGMAMATSLAAWVNTALLTYNLIQRGFYTINRSVVLMTLKITALCILMALALYGGIEEFSFIKHYSPLHEIVFIGGIIFVGMFLYFGGAVLLGVIRLHDFKDSFKKSE